MKTKTKTKRERVTEREEAILEAATDAFMRGGLRAARMAEIAKAADVAEGTLYLYYKNKEALFAAVVARHWRDLTRGATAAIAGIDEPQAQLNALAAYTLGRILDDWKLFELTFFLQYGSDEGSDATDRQSYVRIFDAVVTRGIDRGDFAPAVPVRHLRDLFFGSLEYSARSMLLYGDTSSRSDTLTMVSSALEGVLRAGGEPPRDDLATRLEAAVERLETLAR